MNISRSISRLLSSSIKTKLPSSSPFSTRTLNPNPSYSRKPKPQPQRQPPPRPSEIPYQAKVANAVQLVGTIGVPIELQKLGNGLFAVSVLVQEKGPAKLWFPVIFHGDLAQVAACHLKENDYVYVTGQLIGEEPSSATIDATTRSQVQVLVSSVSFVQQTTLEKDDLLDEEDAVPSNSLETSPESKLEQCSTLLSHDVPVVDTCSTSSSHKQSSPVSRERKALDTGGIENLWQDLLDNPQQWLDNREKKNNGSIKPRSPDFSHKDTKTALWLNSAPSWFLAKFDTSVSNEATKKEYKLTGSRKPEKALDTGGIENLWQDLLDNPQQWWDNREKKNNGSIKPKSPDFSHKDTKTALWLNSAPSWFLAKFDTSVSNDATKKENKLTGSRKPEKDEELWKNLVENPSKWWDNRFGKLNPKTPDFKHKVTGSALWLGSLTPSWVLPKLPRGKSKQDGDSKNIAKKTTFSKKVTLDHS